MAACDRTFNVTTDKDVVRIREYSRIVAEKIGFSANERTLIATVVSEICRNIIEYAKTGQVIIQVLLQNSRIGILITAVDNGPGISNIDMAMKDGFSTGRGMGIGLPGSRRIMDDFEIESTPEYGTTVIMRKWLVQ
ncbi:MAG: anti-sigma regulatory factor [Balneolaceae bacterium]